MQFFKLVLALAMAASASAFVVPTAPAVRASRAASPVAQFGTGNTDNNGFDEKGNSNFAFSPIVGGSKEYPYGQFELDQSGELPAKLLAFLSFVGLPAAFAYGIWTS